MSEYDERVLDYHKINYGNYIVKLKDDERLEDEVKKANTLPLQLAAFIPSNCKRIMNNFIHAIDGFFTNDVYYKDTDSLYILKTNIGINQRKLVWLEGIFYKAKTIMELIQAYSMDSFSRQK